MVAWWIPLLAVATALVLVFVRAHRGPWLRSGGLPARPPARGPARDAIRSPRTDAPRQPRSEAPAAVTARPRRTTGERVAPPDLVPDLSGLQPAVELRERPWDEPPDPAILSGILARASEVLNRVATRRALLEAITDPASDPRKLTDVVVSDPALSARILGTVNSSFYALRHPMASVFRAVLYLGHNEVRSLVWKACFAEALPNLPGAGGELLDAAWRHSFAVSRVAYALGRVLGAPQPDTIATAALLHDAGKLVVMAVDPEKAEAVYRPLRIGSAAQLRREWELVGAGHGLLGGAVARAWGLPAEVAAGVAQHHLPGFLSPDHVKGNAGLVGIVYLADLLCHAVAPADTQETLNLPVTGWLRELHVPEDLSPLRDITVLRALRAGADGSAAGEPRAA
jgi:putative nucleotidyltransferase with HDIG domain